MKRCRNLFTGSRLHLVINVLLALVLVFSLYPATAARAKAQPPETASRQAAAGASQPAPSATVTVVVDPAQDTEIKSRSEKITLLVPAGAVTAPTKIDFAEYVPPGSTGTKILHLFELNASLESSGEAVSQFSKDLTISIRHDPGELAGLDVDSLRLYFLDEKSRQWMPVPNSKYDHKQGVLTATVDHFTNFGEQANPLMNGPGRVMAAQVDLHSGAAVFSYPFELPPGPGGFQPKLELTYNSGSVDEMKNKRATGSWVGIGWSLHLGRISYDAGTGQYFLDLNGASYELTSPDGTNYRTNPDQYFKITRSGNTWEMKDKDGVYYRFGGTTDSQQYLPGSEYYRWDLSLMRDTNNNEATVSYVRDIRGTSPNAWVRSAYPEYLYYNGTAIEVHFVSSTDESTADGDLRKDNPISYGSNPAPKVMETRKLDAIEIKVSSNLKRKYSFTYNTTDRDRVYSSHYGGIYYSGKHTLSSVTQVGADGSSTLPAMAFTYSDKQIYRHTSEGDYVGNPGNPASFSWPHLTGVNSGYGGSISFSYTQKPDTTSTGIWTREIITGKTVNSGIGATESYSYTYTTGTDPKPQYLGTGWSQKYRGFGEVKETDAAGNYVKHYFYTTGVVGGKNAEKLSGKEYKTQWYNSHNALLRETTSDWSWKITRQNSGGSLVDVYYGWEPFGNLSGPRGVAVFMDGYVYIADTDNDRVLKADFSGNPIANYSGWEEYGTLNDPSGVAVSMTANSILPIPTQPTTTGC